MDLKQLYSIMDYNVKISYDGACLDYNFDQWKGLMHNAKKANGRKIRLLIKRQLPKLYYDLLLEYPNLFEHRSKRTNTHLIYVHSGIEYFLRIK